jgi:hypothetical protein
MDEEIAEIVAEHGWFGANVSDAEPPFFYTIGLMKTFDHPELIIFGLEPEEANALFQGLIRDLREGKVYKQPGVYTITLGKDKHQVGFRTVHETQHELYLGFAMGFMRGIDSIGELEAMQVFWPDRAGKFPFDVGCELEVYNLQPRLDIGLTPRELRRFQRQFE